MSVQRCLILGFGNPLRGDDGIGPRLVEELRRRGLPDGVEAIDGGTGGLDLLSILEGADRVIIVDAAEMGRRPGEIVRFTPKDGRLMETLVSLSTHTFGLADGLALARSLGYPLPSITIFGVQPERMDWGEGLSPPVERALPALIQTILSEIGANYGSQNPDR